MFVGVLSFLDKENIIYKQKFGFRPKHSTTHAIISITEKIREGLIKVNLPVGYLSTCKKPLTQ